MAVDRAGCHPLRGAEPEFPARAASTESTNAWRRVVAGKGVVVGWLAAVIAIIAVVWFAIVYPGFRKLLGMLALTTIGFAVVGYFYLERQNREQEKQTQLARSRISISAVDLQNFTLSNEYGSWKIKGVVKNNAASLTLKDLSLKISITNCDANGRNCVVVGAHDSVFYSLNVPPGQARAADNYVWFSNLPPLQNWNWSYQVNYIEATK
jgi:hypothetical protein